MGRDQLDPNRLIEPHIWGSSRVKPLACGLGALAAIVLAGCQSAGNTPSPAPSSPATLSAGKVPPARWDAAAAFDPLRGDFLLFGGRQAMTLLDDTWVHDAHSWVQISTQTHPSARFSAAASEDVAHHDLVLFGGASSSGPFADTWLWADQSWTEVHPTTSPSPRFGHSMAYDSSRGKVVLFGGQAGPNSILNDTGIWDGHDWSEVKTPISPNSHAFSAMAFDPHAQLMVLIGIYPDSDASTWTFDGTNWIRHPSGSGDKPLVNDTPSAYYPTLSKIFIVVAQQRSPVAMSQLLAWDGTRWTPVSSGSLPPARGGEAFAYCPSLGRLLLFGGAAATVTANGLEYGDVLADTWSWDGHVWTR